MNSIADIASRFVGGPHAPAYVCSDAWERGMIFCVKREGDIWYFLCGDDHGRRDKRVVVTVAEVVARDPSLASLATLNEHPISLRMKATRSLAWRKSSGASRCGRSPRSASTRRMPIAA